MDHDQVYLVSHLKIFEQLERKIRLHWYKITFAPLFLLWDGGSCLSTKVKN